MNEHFKFPDERARLRAPRVQPPRLRLRTALFWLLFVLACLLPLFAALWLRY